MRVEHQHHPSEFSNYLVEERLCNAFAVGEVGSTDDFFLVAAQPEDECHFPLITANILDRDGNIMCRLVRNVLVSNPAGCSRVLGDQIGYDINDADGRTVLHVRSRVEKLAGEGRNVFVTTIGGDFHDRHGQLAFRGRLGGSEEGFGEYAKRVFGFSDEDEFGLNHGYADADEQKLLRVVLASRGSVHQLVRGRVDGEEFSLDGKALFDAMLTNCTLYVATGEFVIFGNIRFEGCRFSFYDAADNIRNVVQALSNQE